jgi:hypothetical protein
LANSSKPKLSRVLTDRGTEYCGNPEQVNIFHRKVAQEGVIQALASISPYAGDEEKRDKMRAIVTAGRSDARAGIFRRKDFTTPRPASSARTAWPNFLAKLGIASLPCNF